MEEVILEQRPGLPETGQVDARAVWSRATRKPGERSEVPSTARWAFFTALWPWVLSRVLVASALAIAREISASAHPSSATVARIHQGLLGWDAGWYESIARHGYWGAGHSSLRFFPLVPALARAVSVLPGVGVGAALVVVANVSALAATAWLAALARRETGDDGLARRAAWLICLAPPAFTMVMGYAEGTLLLLSVGTFWALRRQRWWWAAALGLLAGTCRPLGVLLVLPAAVEVTRGWARASRGTRAGQVGALAGPLLGAGAFCGWVGWRYGSALSPLEIQQQQAHRGALADPVRTMAHDAWLLVHGHHLGSALHLPWVLLALALLVVAFRRWPCSYGVFALGIMAAALTAANLDGFERYALSAFPLTLAGASLTASGRVERVVLVAAGSAMVGYALLAFTNVYVP